MFITSKYVFFCVPQKTGQSAPAFGPEEAKAAAEVHRRIAQEIGVPVKLAGQKRKGSDEGEASPTSASASVSPPPAGAESPKAKKARVDAPAAVSPPPQLPQAHPVEVHSYIFFSKKYQCLIQESRFSVWGGSVCFFCPIFFFQHDQGRHWEHSELVCFFFCGAKKNNINGAAGEKFFGYGVNV